MRVVLLLVISCAGSATREGITSSQAAPPAAHDSAEGDTSDTALPPEVQRTLDAVKAVIVQTAQQDARTTAIERYLVDQLASLEGKAPKGWVQPSLEEYCKPDAPTSFIPAPPAPVPTSTSAKR